MKQIIKGTKEQRINRMTRMALEWQDDARTPERLKNSSYYFRKYHIGPYKTELFNDIKTANITREWVLNKMNMCYNHKRLLKEQLEKRKHNEVTIPSLFDSIKNDVSENVEEQVIVISLKDYRDEELINELKERNYKVIKEF